MQMLHRGFNSPKKLLEEGYTPEPEKEGICTGVYEPTSLVILDITAILSLF
ncbi:hypothetical protein OENI_440002 [Oenococcus oeni]|nr:hypothetical protein OENI_440002 [Oenococcus oeni]